MVSKSIALANRLHAECDASPAPIKYSTARRAADELERLHKLLIKARAGISANSKLAEEIDAVLSATAT